eukprot:3627143-Rhodomonas_salina.1
MPEPGIVLQLAGQHDESHGARLRGMRGCADRLHVRAAGPPAHGSSRCPRHVVPGAHGARRAVLEAGAGHRGRAAPEGVSHHGR